MAKKKHVYVYRYKTTFDNGENWKYKIFSSLENARFFGTEYHKTGFKILHYTIEVFELDFKPQGNNVWKDGKVVE